MIEYNKTYPMLFLLPAGLFSLHSVTCAFELTCYSFGEPPDRFYHKVFPISVLKQKKQLLIN